MNGIRPACAGAVELYPAIVSQAVTFSSSVS
jgi:hypothetical protein